MYKQSHFHFVGINGIGMSGIAKILHQQGHIISGCDLALDKKNIQDLIDAGCAVSNQHNSSLCQNQSITTVVYSSDVPYNSQELIAARARGVKTIQRAAILAEIMRTKFSIAVAGSHGKTTTSSMIGHILEQAQTDPTIVVGGMMQNLKNNARYGQGKFVVAETDESDRSHLMLPATIAVVTNVDFEHANLYKNLEEVKSTFTQFINQLPFYGKAIVCLDDKNIKDMLSNLTSSYTTYGTHNQADIQAINIELAPDFSTFQIRDNRINQIIGSVSIKMPSVYNVLNATAAMATCLEIEIPFDRINQALGKFHGVDRRFTYKGTLQTPKTEVFDDYGHHPTEIYNSLITARRRTKNKLIVVFQPQRYSRTHHLWNEFITVFSQAAVDHLILTDIFAASEASIENVTTERLAMEISKKNPLAQIHYIPFDENLSALKEKVISLITDNDLLLLLGAGKINKLADLLL